MAQQYLDLSHSRPDNGAPDAFEAGALLCAAYPERIGKAWKEGGPGCYLLSGGEKVALDPSDILSSYEWKAVASMTSRPGGVGKVFLAAPVQEEDLEKFSTLRDTVFWDRSQGCAVARREKRIGNLLLDRRPLSEWERGEMVRLSVQAAKK